MANDRSERCRGRGLARVALAVTVAAWGCGDGAESSPRDASPGASTKGTDGSGGQGGETGARGGAGGEGGETGAGGGAGRCVCVFNTGLNAYDYALGCKRAVRAAPEVVECITDPNRCGGSSVECTLVHETDGLLEYQDGPCVVYHPPGWRAPTAGEKSLLGSASACL